MLTQDQALIAHDAIQSSMTRLIEEAAREWLSNTTEMPAEVAQMFSEPATIDPEIALAKAAARYVAAAATAGILHDIACDLTPVARDAGMDDFYFRGYVMETAHRILNSEAWRTRALSHAQKVLALTDFQRV